MNEKYIIPDQTRIGHVHLKVSNLQRSLEFYCDLPGFELKVMHGTQAAFISAGGYHHHIGLNTWHSKGLPPAPVNPDWVISHGNFISHKKRSCTDL